MTGKDSELLKQMTITVLALEEIDDEEFTRDRMWAVVIYSRNLYLMGRGDKHYGDCTKVPMTCSRCFIDNARDKAKEIISVLYDT